jgi:hypothetical protein
MTSNSDLHHQQNGRRQRRPVSRWLVGTGIGLIAGAGLVPALVDQMPVEWLGYLMGHTPPTHFMVVPAQKDPSQVDIASVVVLVGIALSIAGLAARARERRRTGR